MSKPSIVLDGNSASANLDAVGRPIPTLAPIPLTPDPLKPIPFFPLPTNPIPINPIPINPIPINPIPINPIPINPIPINPIPIIPNLPIPNPPFLPPIPTNPNSPSPATPTPPNPSWFQSTCADVSSATGDTVFQSLINSSSGNGIEVQAAVITKASLVWDNGTVLKYSYHPKFPGTTNQQNKVDKVIQMWETYANIRFQRVTYDPETPADIRVTFQANCGSWCYVAQQLRSIPTTDPTTNLGWISLGADITDDDMGVILHEFGHALGFMHEHQSPTRGGTITLKPDAVIQFYSVTQGWSADQVKRQILDVYNLKDVSNFSALDLTSIMMYFLPAEMDTQGIDVPPNNKLSDTDKAFAFINYPYPGASPFDPTWTMERALNVAGVNDAHRAQILQAYAKQDWKNVRYYFTLFCAEARAASLPQNPSTDDTPTSESGLDPSSVLAGPDLDILIDDCDAEDLVVPTDTDNSGQNADVSHGITTINLGLWLPGQKIGYTFLNPPSSTSSGPLTLPTDYRKQRVRDIFSQYQQRMNLQFVEIEKWDPSSSTPPPEFRISFGDNPVKTSWSYVGRFSLTQGLGRTKDSITKFGGIANTSMIFHDKHVPTNEFPDKSVPNRKGEMRVLFHEIGHALGLHHEQASPNTFTWKKEIKKYEVATPFDSKSVMLYPNMFLKSNGIWTNIRTQLNVEPSTRDYALLGAIYPGDFGVTVADNKFLNDLATLGLTAKDTPDSVTKLLKQRKLAFANKGDDEKFKTEIFNLRILLNLELTNYARTNPLYFDGNPPINDAPEEEHGVQAPKPSSAVLPPTSGPFITTLLKNLQDLFSPSSGQIFALQFPGRFLQQELYSWDTSTAGIYGQFVKPTVVNESEFRLVDQLYNVGSVIGAPNGINLSIVYEQCLNNLLPGFQSSSTTISKQQDQIRQWLLKDVPITGWVKDLVAAQHSGSATSAGTAPASSIVAPAATGSSIPPPQFSVANKLTGDTVNRMELAEALMQEYLSAKQTWELERDDLIKSATPETLDDITRRLAHITAVREAQLASKYADAVVRGYSHTIRQYLGYMDIKSPSEFLQDAKDSFRESATSSLDGSLKIYPVQMQPIDWFQGLSTSFSLEDLTQDPDLIDQQINAKSQQLDVLNSRLAALQLSPKTDLAVLQKQLDAAENAYDGAQADLTSAYTSNIISLAESCISAAGVFLDPEFEATAALFQLAPKDYDGIADAMKRVTDAQSAVTKASRAVSRLLSAQALAKATDTENAKTQISLDITAITKDIAELTARRQALRKGPANAAKPSPSTTSIDDAPILPSNITPSGGSRWQDIVLHHTIASKFTLDTSSSTGSTSRSDCGLFLFSSQSEASTAAASSGNSSSESNFDVQIGFRATLVTVDRGGWFQPQFFKQSNGFYHIDEKVSWSKWPEGVTSMDELKTRGETAYSTLNKYLLPAFPVGFIICKDITIKIAMSSSDVAANASNFEQTLSKSTGILCFSTSSSESTSASSKSYSFSSTSDGIIIRIPGPQILGYFLQLTDPDETLPVPDKLPDGFLISDAQYDSTVTSPATK